VTTELARTSINETSNVPLVQPHSIQFSTPTDIPDDVVDALSKQSNYAEDQAAVLDEAEAEKEVDSSEDQEQETETTGTMALLASKEDSVLRPRAKQNLQLISVPPQELIEYTTTVSNLDQRRDTGVTQARRRRYLERVTKKLKYKEHSSRKEEEPYTMASPWLEPPSIIEPHKAPVELESKPTDELQAISA